MIPNRHIKDSLIHYSLLLAICIFIVGVGVLSYFIHKEQQLSQKLYPNIYIDNINVGGKSKEEVKQMFASKHKGLDKVHFFLVYKDQQIATISADQMNLHSNASEIIDRAYDIGRTPNISSRIYQKITTLFHLVPYSFTTKIDYDDSVFSDYIQNMADKYNIPAKNALFTFENGKVTSFREHQNGLKINTDAFLKDVDKSVNEMYNKSSDKVITITDSVVEPEIKLSEANDFGIEELIGEGQSDYHHSDDYRIHNLTLAASKFNGVIMEKDKVFSFNQTIGDVSPLTGYVPGYVILNGKTVLGDGGGVCQVSTTFFRAAMNTGLPIVERHNHAYRVIYYENDAPVGYDATIYLPDVDLKVKNDTKSAILIETEIDPDTMILKFKLYGKKDGRRSEVGVPVITDQTPPPPAVEQEDPTLPRGTTKLVEHAIPGAKSTFTYKVYDANNQITFNKTFVSVYQAWAQVTLVGTKDF